MIDITSTILVCIIVVYLAYGMTQLLPNSVLVYDGPGVSHQCLDQTITCLRTHLTPNYNIKLVNAEYLKKPEWLLSNRLFVMPGGQDLPYVVNLEPQITDLIRDFVYNGGIYIGLCAGAYFASKRVEFEVKRSDYKVIGDRRLALINAIAKGAAFPGFVYSTEQGARAAHVNLMHDNKYVPFYFNGGPYFDIVDYTDIEVIGRYKDGRAAIVKSRFGQGQAIVSGVHIEFDPETMISTTDIIDELQRCNQQRIEFLSELRRLMNL